MDDDNIISSEILDCINDDFQRFVTQKESMLMIVRDFNKKYNSRHWRNIYQTNMHRSSLKVYTFSH